MSITIRAVHGDFVAEIEGFDASRPQTSEAWRQIVGAAHRHGVIRLRGQQPTVDGLQYLASRFGKPQPHILTHFHVDGHDCVIRLSNIVTDGKPWGIYEGANHWHTDMSYEEPPGAATIVHALKTPAAGGGTRVADMYSAYDDLPAAMKGLIEGKVALHHYGNRKVTNENAPGAATKLTEEQKKQVKNVFHKLVRPHPTSGRKALYGVCGTSYGIVGMPDDEALGLLDELEAHATQEKYVAALHYQPGDIAVWDTNCTLHAAEIVKPVDDPDAPQARLLHRVSVKGLSPVFHGDGA